MLHATDPHESIAQNALGELYQIYWYPLYVYARRQGRSPETSSDIVQEVFLELIERKQLAGVRPEKGRFRSYLLAAINHQLADQWNHERRQKRGGGLPHASWDAMTAEERFRAEPADTLSPEVQFDRKWALALLDRVIGDLRAQWQAAGKANVFEAFVGLLAGGETRSYAEIGTQAGLSEGAARITAHRLREVYRESLLEEIRSTVDDPADIADEMRILLAALRES